MNELIAVVVCITGLGLCFSVMYRAPPPYKIFEFEMYNKSKEPVVIETGQFCELSVDFIGPVEAFVRNMKWEQKTELIDMAEYYEGPLNLVVDQCYSEVTVVFQVDGPTKRTVSIAEMNG